MKKTRERNPYKLPPPLTKPDASHLSIVLLPRSQEGYIGNCGKFDLLDIDFQRKIPGPQHLGY